jgi:hypothetical protein
MLGGRDGASTLRWPQDAFKDTLAPPHHDLGTAVLHMSGRAGQASMPPNDASAPYERHLPDTAQTQGRTCNSTQTIPLHDAARTSPQTLAKTPTAL